MKAKFGNIWMKGKKKMDKVTGQMDSNLGIR